MGKCWDCGKDSNQHYPLSVKKVKPEDFLLHCEEERRQTYQECAVAHMGAGKQWAVQHVQGEVGLQNQEMP